MRYSAEQKKKILKDITDRLVGGESLKKICMDKDMPDKATIFRWMGSDEEFATIIARAREAQADSLFDDMTDLTNRMVDEKLDPQMVRVAIWAKQWQAAKLKPKLYGDKVGHTVEGNPDAPIEIKITRQIIKAPSDDDSES